VDLVATAAAWMLVGWEVAEAEAWPMASVAGNFDWPLVEAVEHLNTVDLPVEAFARAVAHSHRTIASRPHSLADSTRVVVAMNSVWNEEAVLT